MALWAIELSEFDVHYRPQTAIKGQIVADFIAEYTQLEDKGAERQKLWSIHTDGSSNQHSEGAGVVILTPEGDKIECMIRLDFPTTNNEAEYEALVAGLDLAKAAGVENMITLRFPGDNKSGQRQLRMQKREDEEVPGRSEESYQRPRGQIRSNPKGRKRMCRPSRKSSLRRVHECS